MTSRVFGWLLSVGQALFWWYVGPILVCSKRYWAKQVMLRWLVLPCLALSRRYGWRCLGGYGLPHGARCSWAAALRFCLLKDGKLFCVSRLYAWLQRDWSLFLRTAVFLATVRLDVLLQCGKFVCGAAAGCFATERHFLLRQSGRMFCYMAASSFVAARHDVLLYRGRLVGQRANSWPPCLLGWILLWCGTRLNRSVALGSKWVVCRYAVARLNAFVVGRFGAQATALRPSKAAAAPSNHRQRHSYLDSQRPIYLE